MAYEFREHCDEEALPRLAAKLASGWTSGIVVALEGDLGAGKTTFARAVLESFGWTEGVRSPTFPIVIEYPTSPPVAHIDLYRVKSAEGLGLEDLLETHLLLVEWPDRLAGFVEPDIFVRIDFASEDREVHVISRI